MSTLNPTPPTQPASSSDKVLDKSTSTMSKQPILTLILAATPSLGIGKNGGLPWPQLKKEMGYFARVTKRVAAPTVSSSPEGEGNGKRKINAVLMGRKTWDSIPARFRPLKERLNIVVTRDVEKFRQGLDRSKDGKEGESVEGPMVAAGILDALAQVKSQASLSSQDIEVDKIFVIGGASIYTTALELPATKRVLLTKIDKEYECDTFFPTNLEEVKTWRRMSREELREWTGEDLKEGGVEEQGVRFEFCGYERD